MREVDRRTPSLPNITVQQLEYLVTVSETDTWAEAAQQIGVTPSALSQGLAELERRLGVRLFERDGRRRTLRPNAAPALDHARRVLASTTALARWASDTAGGRAGGLRVGMIDAAATQHFPQVLRRFRDERPDVELHLVVRPSGELLDRLQRAELDVAVCVRPDQAREGIRTLDLIDDPLVVLAPPGTPDSISPEEWGPWVTFPEDSHTRAVIGRDLAAIGAPFEIIAESHQPEVLREMVRLGLGWTVLPRLPGDEPFRSTPVGRRQLAVARRHDAPPDPLADELERQLVDGASS